MSESNNTTFWNEERVIPAGSRSSNASLTLMKSDEPDLGEIIRHQARLVMSSSNPKRNMVSFREAEDRLILGADQVQKMMRTVGVDRKWNVQRADIGSVIAALPADERCNVLHEHHNKQCDRVHEELVTDLQMASDRNMVGNITWDDPDEWGNVSSCKFTYYDQKLTHGFLKNKRETISHAHSLMETKRHYLPTKERMPPKARKLVKQMPDWLKKFSYVVTGERTRAERDTVDVRYEDSGLLRSAKAIGRAAKSAGQSVASGTQAASRAVTSGVRNVERSLRERRERRAAAGPGLISSSILFDPCLVVGNEWVLVGWE